MNRLEALSARRASADPYATHEILNQSPPFEEVNLFDTDRALGDALAANLPAARLAAARTRLSAFGAALGRREILALAEAANRHPPVLRTHDRFGHRIDEVEYHPAYHALMALLCREGVHTGAWADESAGAHVERAAAYFLYAQVENGTQCPATMAYGAVPALRHDPALAPAWLPKLLARDYDPRSVPPAQKRAALVGMGMTEKQGGSDVRSNTTRAEPLGGADWSLTGHKWFLSAPMCDAWLVLAQAPDGLSCFFVPRFLPDGSRNAVRLQRLKDKLGNRSNASAEVEFAGAWARLLGEQGRGVPIILEMGVYTRLDCAIGTAGLMRGALAQALWHARARRAFGRRLVEQPLMKNVLADLALECEAATALALRLARAYDAQPHAAERLLARVLTPAAKYWICKRGPAFAAEAMEVAGGNGYVEESSYPRIYREMPVNSIWEGSGNVMCLDVLRALARTPEAADALVAELETARGADPAYDRAAEALKAHLATEVADEAGARRLTEDIALTVQGSLLLRHAPPEVALAFCRSRFGAGAPGAFGTLAAGTDFDAIIGRAMPEP